MSTIDDSIKTIIAQRPWLGRVLGLLFALLGYAKGKDMFLKQFGPK